MDFVKLAVTVNRLIDKNGRTVSIQKLSATAVNTDKPWKGPGTPTVETQVDCKGVFVPASGTDLGKKLVSEELLSRADQIVLVGPNVTPLETFTAVLDDGVRWRIEWVQVLKPADVILLYVFGVCR